MTADAEREDLATIFARIDRLRHGCEPDAVSPYATLARAIDADERRKALRTIEGGKKTNG